MISYSMPSAKLTNPAALAIQIQIAPHCITLHHCHIPPLPTLPHPTPVNHIVLCYITFCTVHSKCWLFHLILDLIVCLADVEFGRLQARDLLQHLWTGPISNAPVNIVQGSKSVEVRPVGISKVRFKTNILLAL